MIERLGSYVVALALALASAAPAAAQTDPFQSAPALAPIVKKPASPRPAPRPQRAINRPEPEPAAAATLSPPPLPSPQNPQPVVAAPQPAPPPPEPPSLAGKWSGSNNCPISAQFELNLVPVGRDQYKVVEPNKSSTTGWVSGKLMHVQAVGLLGEQITSDGTIDSPTTMSGKTHLLLGIVCDWWAKKN